MKLTKTKMTHCLKFVIIYLRKILSGNFLMNILLYSYWHLFALFPLFFHSVCLLCCGYWFLVQLLQVLFNIFSTPMTFARIRWQDSWPCSHSWVCPTGNACSLIPLCVPFDISPAFFLLRLILCTLHRIRVSFQFPIGLHVRSNACFQTKPRLLGPRTVRSTQQVTGSVFNGLQLLKSTWFFDLSSN